jgi:hypothetical protein
MRIRRNVKIVDEMGIIRTGSPKKETPHPIESRGAKESSMINENRAGSVSR